MMQKSLPLTFGPQASPARTLVWREWGRDQGLAEASLDSFTTLCGSFEHATQEQLSLKTSTGFSLATADVISPLFSKRWTNAGMTSRGVCLTVSISEFPNNAVASTLLPCIETGPVSEKYFLSQNAAVGILRRVDRMGRNLPPSFRRSLEILSEDPS